MNRRSFWARMLGLVGCAIGAQPTIASVPSMVNHPELPSRHELAERIRAINGLPTGVLSFDSSVTWKQFYAGHK